MSLKLIADVLDIYIHLVVSCLKAFNPVCALLEETLEALVVLIDLKALELSNKICDHVSDFAHILGPDILNSLL